MRLIVHETYASCVNLEHIIHAYWADETLSVFFVGVDRPHDFTGDLAKFIWEHILSESVCTRRKIS